MSTKRNCKLNDVLRSKYPFIEDAKVDSVVLCKKCNGKFSIASGGNADIARHLNSKKHKDAVAAVSSSQSITSHFPSTLDTQTAAIEGVWAFHFINSNHSFKSSDCATKIFKSCFNMTKFSCSQHKCQAIYVFARHAKEVLKEDLAKCNFVSIYTDASNHGNIRIFPVLVRYFHPLSGAHVKVLDITSTPGETSTIISELILSAAEKYGLKKKIVCFCADNARVNFGGDTRGGQNNVYFRFKESLQNPNLIGIGCAAHIEHNALKYACDVFEFDLECVVVKLYTHFYRNTVRVTALKETL